MEQWLGLDPLTSFTLRRIEARGWWVSVQFVPEAHVARCNDGDGGADQLRAAKLLAQAVGITDVVEPG